MLRIRFLQSVTNKSAKICMSTSTQNLPDKKFEHYRNLQALEDDSIKPSGWDEAKPFNTLPGPKPSPIIGNAWRFVLPHGDYYKMDFLQLHKTMYETYGEISILKGLFREDIVFLSNPNDFETLFRNEGVWPIRRSFPSFDFYQKAKSHLYPNLGLVISHGEEWFKIRTIANPVLMQPRNIIQYVDKMDTVAEQFVDNMNYFSKQNPNGEMPTDFLNEVYKWALESVGTVTLDTHIGCLNRDLPANSEPQKVIQSALDLFRLTYKLDILPSMYKFISTRNWRKFVTLLDYIIETNVKHINIALDQLEKEKETGNDSKSVLKQLLKKDRNMAIGMAVDMMLAGIDTTGRILGAAIYYLAKNPKQQEQFRIETRKLLIDKNSPVTKETLSNAPYLKAVVKEVTRLAPIANGNMRITVKDLVLGGYQIPKGTDVMTSNQMLCLSDQHFPKAKEFLPERWLSSVSDDLSHKHAHPFIYAPFGHGPRSCIGKRLAMLELEVALLKIIRNFELSWPHEDMKFNTTTFYGIASPLKVHVKPHQPYQQIYFLLWKYIHFVSNISILSH